MTNAETIIVDLKNVDDYEIAIFVADYINCPSSDDCTYDGRDSSPCTDCKIRWLRSDFDL